MTPSAFRYWASINAIPHHYLFIDWFISLFRLVRLAFSLILQWSDNGAKMKFNTGSESSIYHDCWYTVFAPLKDPRKKQISGEKARKLHYMGNLPLKLPSTDLNLVFGTGMPTMLSKQTKIHFFLLSPYAYID